MISPFFLLTLHYPIFMFVSTHSPACPPPPPPLPPWLGPGCCGFSESKFTVLIKLCRSGLDSGKRRRLDSTSINGVESLSTNRRRAPSIASPSLCDKSLSDASSDRRLKVEEPPSCRSVVRRYGVTLFSCFLRPRPQLALRMSAKKKIVLRWFMLNGRRKNGFIALASRFYIPPPSLLSYCIAHRVAR